MIIGTEDIEYYPHYGKESISSKEFKGFARELFDSFNNTSPIELEYFPQPINRLYYNLIETQNIDFKYPDNPNWNPQSKNNVDVIYSKAIGFYIDGIFVHKENSAWNFDNIKEIGVIRGFTPESILAEISSKNINVKEYSRSVQLIKALDAKRIDAIYLNIDVARYQMEVLGISSLYFNKKLPYTEGSYHLSTIKYPFIIDRINAFIENNNLLINKIKAKYELTAF